MVKVIALVEKQYNLAKYTYVVELAVPVDTIGYPVDIVPRRVYTCESKALFDVFPYCISGFCVALVAIALGGKVWITCNPR
jgi:hypothetical protein